MSVGRGSWRWVNHSTRLLWSISLVGKGLEIIQGPCPESHPADVLGNAGWGAWFLLSLAEPRHLVPFGVCFGGKRERRRVPRVLSCCQRVLPKEEVSALKPHRSPGHPAWGKAGSGSGRAPVSMGGCCEVLLLLQPRAHCSSSSPAARGPSSSRGRLWDGSRAPAVAGAGQSTPRRSPMAVPSWQFLSGGSIGSIRGCLVAGTSVPPHVPPWDPSR